MKQNSKNAPLIALMTHMHPQVQHSAYLLKFLLIYELLFAKERQQKKQGKSAHYSRQSQLLQTCLKSVELVLLCMFQTNLLMGNCSWLTSGTRVQNMGF